MTEGNPCLALINNRYSDFIDKLKFSFSRSIILKPIDKINDGYPSEEETEVLNKLQSRIISEFISLLEP